MNPWEEAVDVEKVEADDEPTLKNVTFDNESSMDFSGDEE